MNKTPIDDGRALWDAHAQADPLWAVLSVSDRNRASLEPAGPSPASAAAASDVAVLLRVRNISGHSWSQPAFGPMAVGNHWLDAAGRGCFSRTMREPPCCRWSSRISRGPF